MSIVTYVGLEERSLSEIIEKCLEAPQYVGSVVFTWPVETSDEDAPATMVNFVAYERYQRGLDMGWKVSEEGACPARDFPHLKPIKWMHEA